MRRKTLIAVFWGAASLFVLPSPATQSEATLAQDLQDALDRGREEGKAVGVSAAVIMPDGETWLGVSGESYPGKSITPNMVFSIESITKMFTASIILELAKEGVLSLEDTLDKWIPAYPNIDGKITIRELLNHTSGITHPPEHPSYWNSLSEDRARFWSPEEILTTFVTKPYFPAGKGWYYSNANYILLKMIIKEAAERMFPLNSRGVSSTLWI